MCAADAITSVETDNAEGKRPPMRIVIHEVSTYEFTRDLDVLSEEMGLSVEQIANLSDEELWDKINNTWPMCEGVWRNVSVEEQDVKIHR